MAMPRRASSSGILDRNRSVSRGRSSVFWEVEFVSELKPEETPVKVTVAYLSKQAESLLEGGVSGYCLNTVLLPLICGQWIASPATARLRRASAGVHPPQPENVSLYLSKKC